ncbi:MAG: rod shape-determining protein MreD [Succinivibrionaceae bacterium]|nr:rod shape-determining protein MreD [Succinivibrionaceae bacterium]
MTDSVKTRSPYLMLIPLTLIALVLSILRLPEEIDPYRPDLLSLLLIYFAIYDQRPVNMEMAWFCGLLLDLLGGSPLGFNALTYAILIYVIATHFRHFDRYVLWQQMVVIGLVGTVAHIVSYWVEHALGQTSYSASLWVPSLVTALCWPLLYLICLLLSRTLGVSDGEKKPNDLVRVDR